MADKPDPTKGKAIPIDWNKVPWWIVIVVIALLLIVNAIRLNPSYIDTLAFLSGYTLYVFNVLIFASLRGAPDHHRFLWSK